MALVNKHNNIDYDYIPSFRNTFIGIFLGVALVTVLTFFYDSAMIINSSTYSVSELIMNTSIFENYFGFIYKLIFTTFLYVGVISVSLITIFMIIKAILCIAKDSEKTIFFELTLLLVVTRTILLYLTWMGEQAVRSNMAAPLLYMFASIIFIILTSIKIDNTRGVLITILLVIKTISICLLFFAFKVELMPLNNNVVTYGAYFTSEKEPDILYMFQILPLLILINVCIFNNLKTITDERTRSSLITTIILAVIGFVMYLIIFNIPNKKDDILGVLIFTIVPVVSSILILIIGAIKFKTSINKTNNENVSTDDEDDKFFEKYMNDKADKFLEKYGHLINNENNEENNEDEPDDVDSFKVDE